MAERPPPDPCHGSPTLLLSKDDVAGVTILLNDLSLWADVFAIMTTEASRVKEMAEVVWMSPPVYLHLREKVGSVDPLNFGDRGLDQAYSLRIKEGVIFKIETVQVGRNTLLRRLGRGVWFG